MSNDVTKMVANNKKAYHDFFIEEKIEAGIALAGTEVKSLRMGKCSIKEAYIQIKEAAYDVRDYSMFMLWKQATRSSRQISQITVTVSETSILSSVSLFSCFIKSVMFSFLIAYSYLSCTFFSS